MKIILAQKTKHLGYLTVSGRGGVLCHPPPVSRDNNGFRLCPSARPAVVVTTVSRDCPTLSDQGPACSGDPPSLRPGAPPGAPLPLRLRAAGLEGGATRRDVKPPPPTPISPCPPAGRSQPGTEGSQRGAPTCGHPFALMLLSCSPTPPRLQPRRRALLLTHQAWGPPRAPAHRSRPQAPGIGGGAPDPRSPGKAALASGPGSQPPPALPPAENARRGY